MSPAGPDLQALEAILRRDPGERGVAALFLPGELGRAAALLHGARHVALVTGFPVRSAGVDETDGPPGAAALAGALLALGRRVTHVTDSRGAPLLRALGCAPLELLALDPKAPASERAARAADWLDRARPDALVAIERPGRAADGEYRNMRGEEITDQTSALDELFLAAPGRAIPTVGVGDGGNEVGMGRVQARVQAAIHAGARIASVVPVEHLVVAGVSTWGAWGLVAALSRLAGRDLLPPAAEVQAGLAALVAAGARDGVTARAEPTIDGLPLAASLEVLEALRAAAGESRVSL